jgi:cytoskeletal protein CcmA (bactofilin family)
VSKRDDLSGFIDQGVRIQGELINTFRVDGNFHGTIRSDDQLIVGDEGQMNADIEVSRLSVSGIVKGKIHARERLEVQTRREGVCRCFYPPSLFIEEGGVLQGSCAVERSFMNPSAECKTLEESQ